MFQPIHTPLVASFVWKYFYLIIRNIGPLPVGDLLLQNEPIWSQLGIYENPKNL